MRICACCKRPTIVTNSSGKRDYCVPCFDKKQESLDVKWAFWVLAITASLFFYVGRASAEEYDYRKDKTLVGVAGKVDADITNKEIFKYAQQFEAIRFYVCDQPIVWWGGNAKKQKDEACKDLEAGYYERHGL